MAFGPRTKAKGYVLAVVAVAIAAGIRVLLGPALGANVPFATFFVAVTAAAGYGGFGPGLAATVLGGVAAVLFVLPQAGRSGIEGLENQVGLALYVVVSIGITLLGNVVRRARNRAELIALSASRDRDQMRITLASIGEGVIVTDLHGRVVSMNPVAETLTGWKDHEGAGRLLESVFKVVSESKVALESPVAKVLGEKRIAALANVILVTRDGSERWIDNNAAPIRDGEGTEVGVVLVFREIVERRRGEAAQRLLASIVESSQDAIYGKSLEGTITSWNAAAERLYGYTAEEAIGQPSTLLIPADRLAEQSAILVRRHESAEHFETIRRRKDGGIIHVSTSISPVRNETGDVVGSSTIARDITPQKRAEEELQKAQEQLREAGRRKDEFLAILAHELRNPLAPLRSALGILKNKETIGVVADEARDMAERQVHHLARLVDDLLDVSRITHDRIELQRNRVELRSVVTSAVETARPGVRARSHELTVDLPDHPIWLDADEVRLAQIFTNLLNNAAQYTPPGGRITIRAVTSYEGVEIQVIDTGLGIAREALPRVFDMFAQVGPKESRAPSSLGIGLRLVKGLVEMHGGSVEAQSAGTGCGSVFLVRLPLSSPPPGMSTPEPLAKDQGSKRRILIVDDNEDAATSLAVLLGLDGHDTYVAIDGPSALEAVDLHSPDIVLLDIGMPGMDGYEVARRVRQTPNFQGIRLVALTGWGQENDRRRAREAGFDEHLTKPVEPSALQAIITNLI